MVFLKKMKILIIIPVYNEELYIKNCINSFINQSHKPDQILIVNDNSTDNTENILKKYSKKFSFIKYVNKKSINKPSPGKKIIQAFNYGLKHSINDYDLIGKFDGDIILPDNYLYTIMNDFMQNKKLGLCSGVIANKKNNSWKVENRYNNDHARGAIKLYSRKCFNKIGGLNETMGWDTLDEMKILYNKFEIKIYNKIIVKQMRNTASRYKKNQYKKQGRVMYLLRYNLILLLIGSIKLAITSKSIISFCHCIIGYINSWINKEKYIVNSEIGKFIRNHRYNNILKKITNV